MNKRLISWIYVLFVSSVLMVTLWWICLNNPNYFIVNFVSGVIIVVLNVVVWLSMKTKSTEKATIDMMKLYVSPNKEYAIYSSEGEWASCFGTVYVVSRLSDDYVKECPTLSDAYKWLAKLGVISKDELQKELGGLE